MMDQIVITTKIHLVLLVQFTTISICQQVSVNFEIICVYGVMVSNKTVEAQVATSLTILGAWIGCMVGNKPSELKGRKFTLLLNNVFFIVGAGLCSLGNVYTLFIGRFIAGKMH
jgi:MFS family permease